MRENGAQLDQSMRETEGGKERERGGGGGGLRERVVEKEGRGSVGETVCLPGPLP